MTLTYLHYHFDQGGAFTAAISIEGALVRVAFAFCSPKDNFSKKKGRLISTGRLNAGKHPIEFLDNEKHPIKQQVLEYFWDDYVTPEQDYFPGWL